MSAAPRILVVEDDRRLQETLSQVLSSVRFAFASTAHDALEQVRAEPFELILVDLGLPDLDGVLLLDQLHRLDPRRPLLVLTSASTRERVLAALRAGACGYLLKEELGARLEDAIHEALAGGMPMSAAAAQYVLEQLRGELPPPGAKALSERERELLQLFARGLTYGQVAEQLGVSINTVRTHVRGTYEKLHAANKAEAVMIALREGWISR